MNNADNHEKNHLFIFSSFSSKILKKKTGNKVTANIHPQDLSDKDAQSIVDNVIVHCMMTNEHILSTTKTKDYLKNKNVHIDILVIVVVNRDVTIIIAHTSLQDHLAEKTDNV
jgi:hypothetical protein